MLVRFPVRLRLQSSLVHLPQFLKPLHHQTSRSPKTLRMAAANHSNSKRPTCIRIRIRAPLHPNPASLCLCIRIRAPGIQNKVSVAILQHSLEKKHPLNSARIAKLGLSKVSIDSVSDVHSFAQFVIRLLEPGPDLSLGGNGLESSYFDQVFEMKDTQKRKFDEIGEFDPIRGSMGCSEDKGSVFDAKNETASNVAMLDDRLDANNVGRCGDEAVITATIEKFGAIRDAKNVWMPEICLLKKPSFDQILGCEAAADALRKGFEVKKWQKMSLDGNVELDEHEEFEMVVPPGSVLLFPSEKAIGVNELEEMKIEVKNLIVLDGTWAKARRMYSENPWLMLLPHLKLDLDKFSLYSEVRQQPKAGYLSTIESIVYALKALGDDPSGLDDLLDVFKSMVGDQRRCKDERLSKIPPV